jgi:hypothetical protein
VSQRSVPVQPWDTPPEPRIRMKNAGTSNGMAKLDEDSVRAIRVSTEPHYVIAYRHGISQSVVSMVKNFKLWRHVK